MSYKILVSTADRTGLEKFQRLVEAIGARIVSIGGSASYLKEKGVGCDQVTVFSSFITMMDEGLADLIVFSLPGVAKDPATDKIEWMRYAIIRQAAINYSSVGVVVDPDDYDFVIGEILERGDLSEVVKMKLARKAFIHLSEFDRRIADWFQVPILNEETGFGTTPSNR